MRFGKLQSLRIVGIATLGAFLMLARCAPGPGQEPNSPADGDFTDPIIGGLIDLAGDPNQTKDPIDPDASDPNDPIVVDIDDTVDDIASAAKRVRFTLREPIIGPRPLTVTCTAPTIETNLTRVEYVWGFDGVVESGLMEEYSQRTHVFRTAGIHTVTLAIGVLGLASPIACECTNTGTTEGIVVIYPRISGHVLDSDGNGVSEVVVAANNADGATDITDANGAYHLDVPYSWSGTVTPQHSEYTFDRENRSYTNLTEDAAGQDFIVIVVESQPETVTLSGHVRDASGNPIPGVSLSASNGGGNTTTDQAGYYAFTVSLPWSGTITPSNSNYDFSPSERPHSNITADLGNQDFTATPVGEWITSTSAWQNIAITAQNGTFTVEFDVKPNDAGMDGVIALSDGAGATYSDFAVLVRFSAAGIIDVRNGGSYGADIAINYAAGTIYHFRLVIDVPAHTYSVYVTPDGSTEQTLGANYAFRTEQNGVASLDNWGLIADPGSLQVRDFTISDVVPPQNQPPTAVDDSYAVQKDGTLNVAAPGVLGNDSDPEGDSLTAAVVTGVSSGSLTLNSDGSFNYTPNTGFSGTDSFTYRANDGEAASGVATVTITVGNQPPQAANDSYAVEKDTPLTVDAPGVLDNDSDPENDPLMAVLEQDVSNGSLTLNSDGSFNYSPSPGFTGTDTFTYKAYDGEAFSDPATVTITVQVNTGTNAIAVWGIHDKWPMSGTVNISVAAYHETGINNVEFTFGGPASIFNATVTEERLDASTAPSDDPNHPGYPYFYVTIDTALVPDGEYTLDATATPSAGTARSLPQITLRVRNAPDVIRYVDATDGNDDWDGLVAADDPSFDASTNHGPWRTLTKAALSATEASRIKRIVIAYGTYNRTNGASARTSYLTWAAAPGPHPIIQSSESIGHTSFNAWHGLEFRDSSAAPEDATTPFIASLSHHVVYHGCIFSRPSDDRYKFGVRFQGYHDAPVSNVLITDCRFQGWSTALGIGDTSICPWNIIIRNATFTRSSGIMMIELSNSLIEGFAAVDMVNEPTCSPSDHPDGIQFQTHKLNDNLIIRNNCAYLSGHPSGDSNFNFIITDDEAGQGRVKDVALYNNWCRIGGGSAVYMSTWEHVAIVHNDFLSDGTHTAGDYNSLVGHWNDNVACIIKDNIFETANVKLVDSHVDYNVWRVYAPTTTDHLGPHGIVDPLIEFMQEDMDDLRFPPGSPYGQAGDPDKLGAYVGVKYDFLGNVRNRQQPGRGAFEN